LLTVLLTAVEIFKKCKIILLNLNLEFEDIQWKLEKAV